MFRKWKIVSLICARVFAYIWVPVCVLWVVATLSEVDILSKILTPRTSCFMPVDWKSKLLCASIKSILTSENWKCIDRRSEPASLCLWRVNTLNTLFIVSQHLLLNLWFHSCSVYPYSRISNWFRLYCFPECKKLKLSTSHLHEFLAELSRSFFHTEFNSMSIAILFENTHKSGWTIFIDLSTHNKK